MFVLRPTLSNNSLPTIPSYVLMVCLPPTPPDKMVQKVVQKIVQGSNGPVHVLPYVSL